MARRERLEAGCAMVGVAAASRADEPDEPDELDEPIEAR